MLFLFSYILKVVFDWISNGFKIPCLILLLGGIVNLALVHWLLAALLYSISLKFNSQTKAKISFWMLSLLIAGIIAIVSAVFAPIVIYYILQLGLLPQLESLDCPLNY